MKITNHCNDTFSLNVLDYMLLFNPGDYFSNNWLKGNIEISTKKKIKTIELEFMQVEELIRLLEWVEKTADKEKREETTLIFIDPLMEFRLWKRGRKEFFRFIYEPEDKSIYTWDLIVNQENVMNFKTQIQELLIQFPIR